MGSTTGHAAHGLWAITSYFNPLRRRRRLANYRLFRRHLAIPLVAVELSFGADFELGEADADVLRQLRGGDILWQKERLLNVALGDLPGACDKVAWLDCDTLIGRQDWPDRVAYALDDFPVVQAFSRVGNLAADAAPSDLGLPGDIEFWQRSVAFAIGMGKPVRDSLSRAAEHMQTTCSPGLAWAARRELLDEHGFYDACIVGGGDLAIACAAYGCLEELMRQQAMNERQRQYYLAWAEPFFDAVRGAVTYVDCDVYHLWHGAILNRGYGERQQGLEGWHFDPFLDLAVAENGAWRWNSHKPLLHRYVKDYFASRKEDG